MTEWDNDRMKEISAIAPSVFFKQIRNSPIGANASFPWVGFLPTDFTQGLGIQLVTCPTRKWGVTSEVPKARSHPIVSSIYNAHHVTCLLFSFYHL